ncbi:methylthioribulose 1-phosphate dehydratase [Herbiconiux moechotypicola]|uniref:Methylthioribulose 1-phosphate dehydratase n=1 Tax=Herbiconiux moechotypicola TaxID=637393 RepID=A0ABN3E064_9MICO|nr:methylthioribulose 1-phosphate dehydratase [Herbiconiux moechotypicola]MCS5731092.1 methylthioribulose 1-phosphate dehydratase [Herbiconiux moechotypicola]
MRAIDDPRAAHGDVFAGGELTDAVITAAGAALAAESARFAGLGWMPGTAGNLSVTLGRDPLRLAVTASGFDKGELTADAVVLVDGEGAWVPDAEFGGEATSGSGVSGASGAGPTERLGLPTRPSAEAGLHARIAAVTGAGAVIHVHALAAVRAGFAWPEGVVLHDLEMLKGIGHSAHGERVVIPVVQNHQDMRVLGDDFERVYVPATESRREVPALIVASHGIYAWGADLKQARWHLELTEALLQIALATR